MVEHLACGCFCCLGSAKCCSQSAVAYSEMMPAISTSGAATASRRRSCSATDRLHPLPPAGMGRRHRQDRLPGQFQGGQRHTTVNSPAECSTTPGDEGQLQQQHGSGSGTAAGVAWQHAPAACSGDAAAALVHASLNPAASFSVQVCQDEERGWQGSDRLGEH